MYLRIKWAAYGIVAGVLLVAMVYFAKGNLTRATAPVRTWMRRRWCMKSSA